MSYCGKHSLDYESVFCPRCAADQRHQELLDQSTDALAETVRAMRESDYARANPGDYYCPHCRYKSVLFKATRCPLCHGEVAADYWDRAIAEEQAERDRKRAREEADRAAEEKRSTRASAAAKAAEEDQSRWRTVCTTLLLLTIAVFVGAFIWGWPWRLALITGVPLLIIAHFKLAD